MYCNSSRKKEESHLTNPIFIFWIIYNEELFIDKYLHFNYFLILLPFSEWPIQDARYWWIIYNWLLIVFQRFVFRTINTDIYIYFWISLMTYKLIRDIVFFFFFSKTKIILTLVPGSVASLHTHKIFRMSRVLHEAIKMLLCTIHFVWVRTICSFSVLSRSWALFAVLFN